MPVTRKRLAEIAHIYTGAATKTSDSKEAERSEKVLTVRSLTGLGIDPSELEAVSLDARDLDRFRVAAGDVLVSARSTTLKTAVVSPELAGTVINTTLIGIRCLPALEPRLLTAWLNHPDGENALAAVSQSATLQMNITVAGLSELEVFVPPMTVQRQMVELLAAADDAHESAIEAAAKRLLLARELVVSHLKNQ
jgi:restriction endonuclease S subunit